MEEPAVLLGLMTQLWEFIPENSTLTLSSALNNLLLDF